MTVNEILQEMDYQRNASWAALQAVEQKVGYMAPQTIVARGYWWGQEEMFKYIKDLIDTSRMAFNIENSKAKKPKGEKTK